MNKNPPNQNKFVFFGNGLFATEVLAYLQELTLVPTLIITTADERPAEKAATAKAEVYVVADYGRIIPRATFDHPPAKTLNLHPSLLPHYRGASPIQSTILNGDKETGVTLMLIDEKLDHGPIVAQVATAVGQLNYPALRQKLARLAAELLEKNLGKWVAGKMVASAQDESLATFTKKIKREDGEIKLTDSALEVERKFRAFTPWPGIFFFTAGGRRIVIKDLAVNAGQLEIKRVLPEGKRDMPWLDYQRGVR